MLYELSSNKSSIVKAAIFQYVNISNLISLIYTVNSKDLFQPQNAKLALRPLKLMRPTVELFQSQLGQNNPHWKPKQPTVGPHLALLPTQAL